MVMSAVSDATALDTQKAHELSGLCSQFGRELMDVQLLVNVDTQRLHLVRLGEWIKSYPVSTAQNGVGQQEGSGQTPLGLHFVAEKFGEGADPFEIFKSRVAQEQMAEPNAAEIFIVGRILWLQGAQPGFNQGKDANDKMVDSHDRYIYIHGTNDMAHIGQAVSAGCVRMNPVDVVDLFEQVPVNAPVYIYKA